MNAINPQTAKKLDYANVKKYVCVFWCVNTYIQIRVGYVTFKIGYSAFGYQVLIGMQVKKIVCISNRVQKNS